jgi:hypothetical protein
MGCLLLASSYDDMQLLTMRAAAGEALDLVAILGGRRRIASVTTEGQKKFAWLAVRFGRCHCATG